MNRIWGPVSPTCDYQPAELEHRSGRSGCSLGVPAAASVGANSPGWTFTTHAGHPVTMSSCRRRRPRQTAGVVRARAARAGSDARATQLRARVPGQRAMLGPLRFTGRVRLARRLRLRRMRVVVERTLFEHGRREEFARSGSGRRLRPFTLRHVRHGLFTSRARRASGAPASAASAPTRRGQVDLRLTRVRTRDIRALCTTCRPA